MNGVLIDENLPARLSIPTDLEVRHVSTLGNSPTDSEIWEHAKTNDLVIVTKDADFSHRIAACDPPPRAVHIRIGNMRLRELIAFIQNVWPKIESHVPLSKLINVSSDQIDAVS